MIPDNLLVAGRVPHPVAMGYMGEQPGLNSWPRCSPSPTTAASCTRSNSRRVSREGANDETVAWTVHDEQPSSTTTAPSPSATSRILDNIADAIALLEAVNVPTLRMGLIVHPRNVATLRKSKASTAGTYLWSSAEPAQATPRTVFGLPVYTSPQLSTNETKGTSGAVANSAYPYDTQSLVYVQRSPIEIELDRSRLFNSDQSEIRAKLRGDVVSPTPTGIVRLNSPAGHCERGSG